MLVGRMSASRIADCPQLPTALFLFRSIGFAAVSFGAALVAAFSFDLAAFGRAVGSIGDAILFGAAYVGAVKRSW